MYADVTLGMCFTAETEDFRIPLEPDGGDLVTVRLRLERPRRAFCTLCLDTGAIIPLVPAGSDELFSWYEARMTCPDEAFSYHVDVRLEEGTIRCQRFSNAWVSAGVLFDPQADFRVIPGFHTPDWAKGALQYQIFPDRFRNADPTNDVTRHEYVYDGALVAGTFAWDEPIHGDDYRCFYGGDLAGIISKLDYLQSLGVEALYLNPIFVSPSSHKYDVQDYLHVDPHLGRIVDDGGEPVSEDALDNVRATRYIRRTTSGENLAASDALFCHLCQELHARGMRIILDGVFNHSGVLNHWMDRDKFYGADDSGACGAYRDVESPYRSYYDFHTDKAKSGFDCWYGIDTLPKLNYEASEELCADVIAIARHWAAPPYSIDGWRLDVAADLGHSERFNHRFWRRFRDSVREVNPEILIVAEHYGPARAWLDGKQWDTLMNYDAFMEPLTFFLTGLEKHSDTRSDDLYQNGGAFFETILAAARDYSWPSLTCAMNELSNHDHSRFLTRTNGLVGRLASRGRDAASEGVDKAVLREAVAVQMSWPGAPTIYYGDEAGLVGWTDPDNRRPFPWGREDQDLIGYHRALASLRVAHPALRAGALVPLGCGYGWIAFARLLTQDRIVTVVNNNDGPVTVSLRVRGLGLADGVDLVSCLRSTREGYFTDALALGTVRFGYVQVTVAARSAYLACA